MAYNKFITRSGRIFLDLTNDTITPEDLREGVTAHDRSGNLITGTGTGSEDLSAVLSEQKALILELKSTLEEKAVGNGEPIEVDVLPTENIDKESIYKVKTSFEDMVMFLDDEASSLKALSEQIGGQFTANVIPTRTTENIQETNLATFIIHAYYIEDENDIFFYGDFTESGNPVWLSVSFLTGYPFQGIITDVLQATIDGYYLLGGGGYYKYFDASFDDIVYNGESLGAMTAGMYYESTKPTENIQASDLNNELLYLYYIADENDIFVYTEGQWLTIGEVAGSGSFGGTITDISEAVNPEYYYAVVTPAGFQQLLIPSGTVTITENGTHDVAAFASAEVKVEPILEEITITENGEYTPSGDGYSKVTVEVEGGEVIDEYDGTVVIE